MEKDTKKQRIKTRCVSIETKMAMNGIIIGLLICAVLSMGTYFMVSEYLVNQVKSKVTAFAEIIAVQTDGDLFESLVPGDEETEAYQEMQKAMFDFFNDKDVTYAYSLKNLNDQEVEFIVAADPEGAPCLIGETYGKQKEMEQAFTGKTSVTDKPAEDEWGVFYTAYAPIYNTKGKIVGIVGVDCESSNIQSQVKVLMGKLLGIGLIVLSFVVMINIILARKVGRNIYAVNQKLRDVVYSDGDLTKKLEVDSGDELEIVAENVNALLENIRTSMIALRTSSGEINQSFDAFTGDMSYSVDQITQVSATMQEMYGSMEETNDSFSEARKMTQEVSLSINDIKEKTACGFEFTAEIEQKSSKLKQGANEAHKQTTEKLKQMEVILSGKIEEAKAVEQIKELTQSIIDMARQTGLLALNANIEAARAGEHGRGFSIVAQEVAKLAEDSSVTANEIQEASYTIITIVDELVRLATSMINYVQVYILKDYEQFVRAGNQYNEDAKSIRELMNGFKEQTQNLQFAMSQVDGSINEIATTIEESMEKTVTITRIAEQMDQNMQQMGEATKENQKGIKMMNEVVSQYKVDEV